CGCFSTCGCSAASCSTITCSHPHQPRLVQPSCLHPRLVQPSCLHPRLVQPSCLHLRLVQPSCLHLRLVQPSCLHLRLQHVPLSRQVNQVQLCLPPVCDFPVSLCVLIVCVFLCSSSRRLYSYLVKSPACSPCCSPFMFRFATPLCSLSQFSSSLVLFAISTLCLVLLINHPSHLNKCCI
uniref:Uncharacterized protein n=1 Tax=Maylandia zebra TaxID=106582 RepID=A0A3P9BAM0_9CICH